MANHSKNYEISYGTYIMVWAGLVALTSITVSIAGLHLGSLTLVMALIIASTKTMLVAGYFMHIKFEAKVFKGFVVVCLVTFIILVILTFTDYSYR